MQDVDYEAAMATKLSIAKKIFVLEKDSILNSSSFHKFLSENEVIHIKYPSVITKQFSFFGINVANFEVHPDFCELFSVTF